MTAKKNAVLLCSVIFGSSFVWANAASAIHAFNAGVKLFNAKQYSDAIPDFDEAVSENPDFAEAYFARGACKYYLKSLDGAMMDLGDALRLKPDYTEARALHGAVNYEADRWDDALEDFNAVLDKNPRDAQSLLGRAVIMLKREDMTAAARDFKGFLRVRPDDPLAPKVRQLLASLKRSQEPPRPEEEAGAETEHPASSGRTASVRALSPEDMQKLADSLLSHPLEESYSRKVLQGQGTEAVGDMNSVSGTPSSHKTSDSDVQIVDPQ